MRSAIRRTTALGVFILGLFAVTPSAHSITITRLSSASWGTVTRPPTGVARYSLNSLTGTVTVVSGNGHAFLVGTAGQYLVSGLPFQSVTYSVTVGTFNGSGVTFVSASVNGGGGSATQSLGVAGSLLLRVGGTIDVTSAASPSAFSATITVTVS